MPKQIAASLTTIWPVITAQIAAGTGLQTTQVRSVARGQTPRLIGDQDVLVRPGNPAFSPGFDHGSGRICQIIKRPILVTLRTRLALDMSDQDDSWLLDPTYGHVVLEEKLMNTLLNFVPTDASQNMLSPEPMHPIDWPAEEKAEGEAAQWGETRMAFRLTYQPILTPPH